MVRITSAPVLIQEYFQHSLSERGRSKKCNAFLETMVSSSFGSDFHRPSGIGNQGFFKHSLPGLVWIFVKSSHYQNFPILWKKLFLHFCRKKKPSRKVFNQITFPIFIYIKLSSLEYIRKFYSTKKGIFAQICSIYLSIFEHLLCCCS